MTSPTQEVAALKEKIGGMLFMLILLRTYWGVVTGSAIAVFVVAVFFVQFHDLQKGQELIGQKFDVFITQAAERDRVRDGKIDTLDGKVDAMQKDQGKLLASWSAVTTEASIVISKKKGGK